MATAKGLGDLLDRYVGVGEHLPRRAHLLRRPAAIVDHPNGNWVSPSSYSVGEEVRFALDSLLEGDGFELPVPQQIRSHFRASSPVSHDRVDGLATRNRRFESVSPQRGVSCEPNFLEAGAEEFQSRLPRAARSASRRCSPSCSAPISAAPGPPQAGPSMSPTTAQSRARWAPGLAII